MNNTKLPFDLTFFELLTVISTLSIGYLLIYKYTFYYYLGIPWFSTSLTPSYILFSSFGVMILSIFGLLIAYALSSVFRTKKMMLSLYLLMVCICFLFVFYLKKSYPDIFKQFFSVTLFVFYAITLFSLQNVYKLKMISSNSTAAKTIHKKFILAMASTISIFMYGAFPFYFGVQEAKNIMENKSNLATITNLKGSKEKWFLVEFMNDKVLLMKPNSEFKLVEYKDLETITK